MPHLTTKMPVTSLSSPPSIGICMCWPVCLWVPSPVCGLLMSFCEHHANVYVCIVKCYLRYVRRRDLGVYVTGLRWCWCGMLEALSGRIMYEGCLSGLHPVKYIGLHFRIANKEKANATVVHLCVHACTCVHVCVHACTCERACVCACTYVCMCIRIYTVGS